MDNTITLVWSFVMLLSAALCSSIHQLEVTNVVAATSFGNEDDLTFKYDFGSITRDLYSTFLRDLRNLLGASTDPNGILVLPDPSALPPNRRYFQVGIVYDQYSISVGIDRTNLYVVGYRRRRLSYFFNETDRNIARSQLFCRTTQENLTFSSNYETGIGNRSRLFLGFADLARAVERIDREENPYDHRNALTVIIQMVSEAARYNDIEIFIRRTLHDGLVDGLLPSPLVIRLENRWGRLSQGVQEAVEGVFPRPVDLIDRNKVEQLITRVTQIIGHLLVMKFVCRRPNLTTMKIPTFVYNNNNNYNNYLRMVVTSNDTQCKYEPVTGNIVGRDGKCADVKDGKNIDGTPIILWPCGSQSNQQWTLMQDGTIRSIGKCMALKSSVPGQMTTIFDCSKSAEGTIKWTVLQDGTIKSVKRQLVLTAESGNQGTFLTGEKNLHAARQCWRPDTRIAPIVVSIIGYNDLCLSGNSEGTNVWIQACKDDNVKQQWAIYADGTIRKSSNRDLCITSDGHSSGVLIILHKCSGWANQRWNFQTNGYIMNPGAGLVMDVKDSEPAQRKIILYSPKQGPNQKWYRLF